MPSSDRILWPWAEEQDGDWLGKVIHDFVHPSMKWWPMDSRYWLPTQEDFDRLLAWDPTQHWQYLADRFDCESYAFQLQATFVSRLGLNNVGVVLDYSAVDANGQSSPHAYNLVVFADGSAKFLEPQSDEYVQVGSGLYTCKEGILIL